MTKLVPITPCVSLADLFALVCDEPHAAFLDSALHDEQGRYSLVGLHPSLVLEDREGQLMVNGLPSDDSFLKRLRRELEERREPNETSLPIVAGCLGYLSYDFGRALERVETSHPRTSQMPEALMCFYELLLIEDHERGELYAAVHTDDPERAQTLIDEAHELASRSTPLALPSRFAGDLRFEANFSQADYLRALESLIEHMAAGDSYVANLTQTFTETVDARVHSYDIYRYLRTYNPAPFAAYINVGCAQVLCASMERFVQLRGREVTTRPIKGTRPRGATPEQDRLFRAELEASEKDKSELLMVVDLERNDLSKVCEPGTVKVPALFETEGYATVFHLVATVTGTLSAGKNAVDLIEATFPGGSITGAPKRRTMQIIDELEHGRRGLYTGSIGYLSLDGDADLNIVIRTAVREGCRCTVGAGGGITYESDVDFEYEETRTKARAVLEAIASVE